MILEKCKILRVHIVKILHTILLDINGLHVLEQSLSVSNIRQLSTDTQDIIDLLEFIKRIISYREVPLVSFEEAIKPLINILPNVQQSADIAKHGLGTPEDNLTQDESASIRLYTMAMENENEAFSKILNKTLQNSDVQQKIKPWYLYLRLFINALVRLPRSQKIVYHGVQSDMTNDFPVGKTICWRSFIDCTTTINILENEYFLGRSGKRTMFHIKSQSGRDIRKHSFFPCENMILFLPGTLFKVISCLKQYDLNIIQLEEILPPDLRLQSTASTIPKNSLSTG